MNRQITKWMTLLLVLFLFALTGCGPVNTPPTPTSPTIGDQYTITIGAASYHLRYMSGKTLKTGYKDNGTATVTSKYWITETEVTYEVWDAVYDWALLNGYQFINPGAIGDSNIGNIQQPVTTINWRDAMVWCNALTEYCNTQNGMSLSCVYQYGGSFIKNSSDSNACENVTVDSSADGFRLPTADEWELAARYINDANNDGDIMDAGEYYPGDHVSGDTSGHCYDGGLGSSQSTIIGDYTWYLTNSGLATHPVGLKTANALGVFDMSGNVFEFCFDKLPGLSNRMMRGGCFFNGCYQELDLGDNGANLGPLDTATFCGFRVVKND